MAKTTKKLTAKDYPVDKLLSMLNPINPRLISDDAKSALSEGFYRFGCVEPIIINLTTGLVVGGHQRVTTASESGIKTLPVVELELTPERELALNLALNQIGGSWDYDKLSELVVSIPVEDIFVSGFSASEIDTICQRYEQELAQLEFRPAWETVRSETMPAIGGNVRKSASIDSPDFERVDASARSDRDEQADRPGDFEDQPRSRSSVGGTIDRSQQIRNRLPDEVTPPKGTDANSLSIYFGMFSGKVSIASYEKWVAGLKADSEHGDSPTALGMVVAKRLGLAVAGE